MRTEKRKANKQNHKKEMRCFQITNILKTENKQFKKHFKIYILKIMLSLSFLLVIFSLSTIAASAANEGQIA